MAGAIFLFEITLDKNNKALDLTEFSLFSFKNSTAHNPPSCALTAWLSKISIFDTNTCDHIKVI